MRLVGSCCRTTRALPPRLLAALALGGTLLWGGLAGAFHTMIRHGYSTCSTCHVDPSGAGLLTAYGRGLAETVLRTRWGGPKGQEADPGRAASFAFGVFKMPEWLLLQVDGRGLVLVPTTTPSATRVILMQADAAAQVKVGRFRVSGSLGYAHEGAPLASVTRGDQNVQDRLISRTHWLGVDLGPDDQFLLRAGRMNLPFGVRNIEHTMFVRATTRTNIDDQQQLGVALAWNRAPIRAELMGIIGNFQIRPDDFRERGYSGCVEWAVREKLALGVSSMVTHAAQDRDLNTPLWRHAHGVFGRWSPVEWMVVGVESDFLLDSQPPAGPAAANNAPGNISALLLDFEPVQGLHLLGMTEVQNRNFGSIATDVGIWAGAWWFLLPHLDLRADVAWISIGGQGGAPRQNSTSMLFQLHGYL